MQKRTRYERIVSLLLAAVLSGCQLPPLFKQSEKTPLQPSTTTPMGNLSPKTSVQGRYIHTATESIWVPATIKTQAAEDSIDFAIAPYQAWSADIPTSSTLDLYVRTEWPYFGSGSGVMQVSVNGNVITDHPINQPSQYASYFRLGSLWLVYFIPSYYWNIALNYQTGYGPLISTNDPNSQLCRYVWNIEKYAGNSPTMNVRIYNDQTIIGKYREGFEQSILVRLNQKPAIKLHVDTPYFSPNQDGTLDTAAGAIKAQGPWKLSVVNHGEITTGTGNSDLNWNGEVNGVRLPDGEYTLRLEDANNPSSKAEGKVIIDTVAPKIEDAYIHSIDTKLSEAGEAEFTYSVNASAVDQAAGGVSSDIDATSLEVTFPDAPFTNTGKSLKTEEGEFQAKYNLPSTSSSSPSKLRYTASIKDQAGNKSVGFNKNFSATIEREIQISYEPSVGVAAAGIRALSANKAGAIKPLMQGDVFYSRSGNIARIECYDTWTSSDPKFKGGTATYLVTKISNLIPGEIPAKVSYLDKFRSNVQNKHVFYWNGKQDNKGDYATTGRYIVELEQPWSWLKVKDPKFEFKVSGLAFVSPEIWNTLPPASFFDTTNKNRPVHPLQQIAHLLERHVIDRKSNREELFGYYLNQLLIPAIPGYTYNENAEARDGYKETSKIISTEPSASIYDDVCQLATAAWQYGTIIEVNNTAARDVGITYGNGEVMLIRAVSYDGGKFFHTAYPNYRGKLLYESKIK